MRILLALQREEVKGAKDDRSGQLAGESVAAAAAAAAVAAAATSGIPSTLLYILLYMLPTHHCYSRCLAALASLFTLY
jgi:hypothetical protein